MGLFPNKLYTTKDATLEQQGTICKSVHPAGGVEEETVGEWVSESKGINRNIRWGLWGRRIVCPVHSSNIRQLTMGNWESSEGGVLHQVQQIEDLSLAASNPEQQQHSGINYNLVAFLKRFSAAAVLWALVCMCIYKRTICSYRYISIALSLPGCSGPDNWSIGSHDDERLWSWMAMTIFD